MPGITGEGRERETDTETEKGRQKQGEVRKEGEKTTFGLWNIENKTQKSVLKRD